jgi:hypothetical protein
VQHRRRVGRIAEHDQVGLLGDLRVGKDKRWVEHDVAQRDARGTQHGLRFGERRRKQGHQPRPQVRQQCEALRAAGKQRHLVGTAAVPVGHGLRGAADVVFSRVAAQVVQPRGQPLDQP